MDDWGERDLCFMLALTFYSLPRERKWLLDVSGLADDCPANPATRIFKQTANDSPSPPGEGTAAVRFWFCGYPSVNPSARTFKGRRKIPPLLGGEGRGEDGRLNLTPFRGLLGDEPEETTAVRQGNGDFIIQVCKIEHGRVRQRHPTRGAQIQILLQHKIRRRHNPGKGEIVA